MAAAKPSLAPAPRIGPVEAYELLESGKAVAIDVRPTDLFAAGHIPGAWSIPIRQLGAAISRLPPDKRLIFY
jgi:rhodanese-related sulfurtransferase